MLTEQENKNIRKIIEQAGPALVISHKNPDGDAVGSSVAMGLFLQKLNIPVSVILPNEVPDFLKWIPGFDLISIYRESKEHCARLIEEAGLIIFVDFNEPDRMDEMKELISVSSATKILVDHHQQPMKFADHIISAPWRGSAGEMIFILISELGYGDLIDKDIASALYSAIMTDTGNFRYGSSYPELFTIVGKLLEKGIDKDGIFSRVYDSYSVDRMKLMGHCLLQKMVVLEKYNAAYISLSDEELKQSNHKVGDTEGFVNIPFTIEGIRLTALFIEKKNHVKISLRSKGNFSVHTLAREHFNGGGHINAAGGQLDCSLEEALKQFEAIISVYKDELS